MAALVTKFQNEHGGNIHAIIGNFNTDITDFSANINPLGLPEGIRKAIYNNFDKILHYPDPDSKKLIKGIAEYWGVKTDNIMLGNGSSELIYLITHAVKPKTCLIPIPTFSEYENAVRNLKCRITFLKLNEKTNFRLNERGETYPKPDICFLCNPNNPTGNLIVDNYKAIEQIKGNLTVIDEAFMDFLPDEDEFTMVWKSVKKRGLLVLRTLTKFFAMPGLRIGYLISHKETVRTLKQYQHPWNINCLAQIAAELMLKEENYPDKTFRLVDNERRFLIKEIGNIPGFKPFPSVTNFILVKIERTGISSKILLRNLIEKGILIRDCSNFRGLNDKYFRIAVRSHNENLKLLNSLGDVPQGDTPIC